MGLLDTAGSRRALPGSLSSQPLARRLSSRRLMSRLFSTGHRLEINTAKNDTPNLRLAGEIPPAYFRNITQTTAFRQRPSSRILCRRWPCFGTVQPDRSCSISGRHIDGEDISNWSMRIERFTHAKTPRRYRVN